MTHDLPALLADADRVIAAPVLLEAESLRLAAFVRSVADPTPADADWLDSLGLDGWDRGFIGANGIRTRGRVRLFAAAMGLQLREGEPCSM